MFSVPRGFHALALLLGLVVALYASWPVAAHLRDSLVDGARVVSPTDPGAWGPSNIWADVLQTTWILNWILHALVTQPFGLFDANIFYPAPLSLARSDHMIATALLGIPGALLGGPVIAHQSALLLCLVLAFWSTAYVTVRWTGSTAGGLVAGTLFAASPYHQWQLAHLQDLGTAYFPLILFGLDAYAATGARRALVVATVAFVAQALSGAYLAYFALLTWAVAAVTCVAATDARVVPFSRRLLVLSLATAAAALLIAPFALPYLRLAAGRELADNLLNPWTRLAGLRTPAVYVWGAPGGGERMRIVPAWWLLIAAGIAGLPRLPRGGARAATLVGLGVLGALFSLGPIGPAAWLYRATAAVAPGFATMREPARWAVLVYLPAAILAGMGVAALVARSRRWGSLAASGLVALLFATTYRAAPVPLRRVPVGEEVPAAYRFLARCGSGDPLLELPVWTHLVHSWHDVEPAYYSVFHWLPLLNGRGSYLPESYFENTALAAALPDADAENTLRARTGLRWVLVHCDAAWPGMSSIEPFCGDIRIDGRVVRQFGALRLFDLGPPSTLPRPVPKPVVPPDCDA